MPNLIARLERSSKKTIKYFESQLDDSGSLGTKAKDLSCYFKSPMMFILAKKPIFANLVLNYINTNFMTKSGDFVSKQPSFKSDKSEYTEYWIYANVWIARAAHVLKRQDILVLAYKYISQYKSEYGFLTNNIDSGNSVTDVLTTAHLGLVNLEMGNKEDAIHAGDYLSQKIDKQPNISEGFYLRFNESGKPITKFNEDKSVFFYVSKSNPNQLYFMLAYPCAYLALLYKETKNKKYLNASKEYLNFILTCHENSCNSQFSHKTAWAASILYSITQDRNYLKAIERITNYFINTQSKEGLWFKDDVNTSFDQSAEIACWFMEISKNLKPFQKKIELLETRKNEKSHSVLTKNTAIKYGVWALVAGLGIYTAYKCTTSTGESLALSPIIKR